MKNSGIDSGKLSYSRRNSSRGLRSRHRRTLSSGIVVRNQRPERSTIKERQSPIKISQKQSKKELANSNYFTRLKDNSGSQTVRDNRYSSTRASFRPGMSSISVQRGSSFHLNKLSLQIVKDNIKAAEIIHKGSTPFINLKKKLMPLKPILSQRKQKNGLKDNSLPLSSERGSSKKVQFSDMPSPEKPNKNEL